MNPCKCGYFNHPKIECKCTPFEIKKYQNRISGPIFDRIDICIDYDGKIDAPTSIEQNTSSLVEFDNLKSNILRTRELLKGIKSEDSGIMDSKFSSNNFIQNSLSDKSISILKNIQEKYSMSNRKYFKILNLALTLALFNDREIIYPEDILEATQLSKIQ